LLSDRAPPELHGAENRARDFLLPSGKQLSEAEQLLAEYGEELTPELKAYVAASMAQFGPYWRLVSLYQIGALTFSFGSGENELLRTARSRLFPETSYSNSKPSFVHT
jgi:hypothetical protein